MQKNYIPFTKEMKKEYTVLVPNMLPIHFRLLTKVFRSYGINMEVLFNEGEHVKELGLRYVIVDEDEDNDNDSLKVAGQLPASGAYVEKSNGVIYLYTDKSLMVTDIEVPDLIGMDAMTANAQLTARGLNIRIEGSKYHLTGTGATVYEQSIPAGTKVAKGQVITVKCRTEDEDYISNPID